MKTIFRITLMVLFIVSSQTQAVYARTQDDIRFDKIETDFAINTFIQDRDGFFWIGAVNGLHKYDGYSFKPYVAGPGSIAGNYVTTLYEDSRGLIWIASQSGLSMYDKATDSFTSYLHDPDDPSSISSNHTANYKRRIIAEDGEGMIWIGTDDGLNRFDPVRRTFTRYENLFIDKNICGLYLDADRFLWVGTANGLHKFNPRTGKVSEQYETDDDDPDGLHGNDIVSILEDNEGTLWAGTMNRGVNCLAKGGNFFTHFRHKHSDDNSLSNDAVAGIMEDMKGTLWLITINGGLNQFDKASQTFIRHNHDPGNPHSISSNYLTGIYQDAPGVIWVSSYGGTLHRIDPGARKFQSYVHEPGNPNSLSRGDYIAGVIEDQEGIIWVAVGGYGINRYDRNSRTFTHYRHDPDDPASLPESYGQSLIEDSSGHLWVGTNNSIVLFDKQAGKAVRAYPAKKNWPSSPVEDSTDSDVIWWGTWGAGLLRFNKSDGNISYFASSSETPDETVSSNTIPFLYQDDTGMIWLCTRGGGLDKFDPQTKKVTAKYKHSPGNPDTISSNSVYEVYQDSAGRCWVTTDRGFNRFDPDTGKFDQYNRENGRFPLNSAGQIQEDGQGNLWISGYLTGELVKFNPESGDYRRYTTDDGILSRIGSTYAAIRTRDGALWFFGNGINTFYPDQIRDNAYQPQIFLTSLAQGGDALSLRKAPERTESIQLDWRNNFFEFEAAALNYRHPQNNQYRYILEGVDKGWFEAGTNRHGRYSGLPDGIHTLKVMGSNNDGLWSDKIAELKVIVTPPFWRTWWFRIAAGLMIIAGCIGGYFLRISTLEARSRELEQQVDERTRSLMQENKERRRAEESLKTSERRLSDIISFLPDATFVIDHQGKVIAWNKAMEIMTGINAKEMIGKGDYEYALPFYGDRRPILIDLALQAAPGIEKTYDQIQRSGDKMQAEHYYPNLRGRETWLSGNAIVLRNSRGKITGAIETIRDTTERKRSEIELQKAKEAAETANLAKSTFLASMSHELRTPLNGILGYAQILKGDSALTNQQRDGVNIIEKSGNYLLALINDILDLAKIESGKTELAPVEFSFPAMLGSINEMFRLKAENKGLRYRHETSAESGSFSNHVYGDEKRLRQILINLLGNAVKFTQKGMVALRVKGKERNVMGDTHTESPLIRLHFEIEDTGIGIAPEDLEKIFNPFEQTGGQEYRAQGTGLGLSITRDLIKQMGGELHVSSRLGSGSTFVFELTLPEIRKKEKKRTAEQRITGIRGAAPKILVVDDEQVNLDVYRDLLIPLGCETAEAGNGRDGLEKAETFMPDLIITDLVMPEADGFELIRYIRQSPGLKDKIIFASSASVYPEDQQKCFDTGADAFIPKPVEAAYFFRQLEHFLEAEWIYTKTGDGNGEEDRPGDGDAALTPVTERLGRQPADLRKELMEAAIGCDLEEFGDILEKIRETDKFLAEALGKLVSEFRFDVLLEMLEGVDSVSACHADSQ